MILANVMTTNVVSIPSNTTLAEARRLMDARDYSRLPVIDKGKLVGMVSKNSLEKYGPSKLSSYDFHELAYMLNKIQVKEVMHRDVVTASPDMYIDDAIALVQSKRVGMLVVVEKDSVVGVVTTRDVFFRIVNPVFGVNTPGQRIYVENCSAAADIEKVMGVIKNFKVKILAQFCAIIPDFNKNSLVVQMDGPEASKCVEAVKKLGYTVNEKAH